MNMELKKTPIYDAHVEAGGRIVPFAGYLMPVSFEGIVAEHQRVRTAVGLFDVSHMGEISIVGPGARAFTDRIVTNDVDRLERRQVCYTVACNDAGRVLDDLLVYKFSEERILLVVNAVNVEKIFKHVASLAPKGIEVRDLTAGIAQIAVQGPRSRELVARTELCGPVRAGLDDLKYYRFVSYERQGREIILSRTGYTGELGFEIYLPADQGLAAWRELMKAGADLGVGPIGLGARDTLRFESCLCLYGHELSEETSPLEAGLSWLVKLGKKDDFLGKRALAAEKKAGPKRMLAGFEVGTRQIARQGYAVMHGGSNVGAVTSGSFAPTLQRSLALALVSSAAAGGIGWAIDVRGKAAEAKRVAIPFYKSRAAD